MPSVHNIKLPNYHVRCDLLPISQDGRVVPGIISEAKISFNISGAKMLRLRKYQASCLQARLIPPVLWKPFRSLGQQISPFIVNGYIDEWADGAI